MFAEIQNPRNKSTLKPIQYALAGEHARDQKQKKNKPFVMTLVSFSTGVYFVRPELEQPLIQLPCSPIEPILPGQYHSLTTLVYRSRLNTHFGYELSPSPNDAKFTPRRNVGESRFTSNDFQNNSPFAGISPWPVVEVTKIVNVCDWSDSYTLNYCQLTRGS